MFAKENDNEEEIETSKGSSAEHINRGGSNIAGGGFRNTQAFLYVLYILKIY